MTLSKRSSKIVSFAWLCAGVAMIVSFTGGVALAQESDIVILEQRVAAIEDYVVTIPPTLVDLSKNLNISIQKYTNDLEASLETYSKKLQYNLDQRIEGFNRKAVVLNPFSKDYQTIQTNTGTFLIAIERMEPIKGGVRLHVNIGNPNYADYQNFKLKFFWGRKRGGEYAASYGQWRQSLKGVEFTFNGKIEKGKWNAMAVDLTPVGQGDLGYLECTLSVSSIELGIE